MSDSGAILDLSPIDEYLAYRPIDREIAETVVPFHTVRSIPDLGSVVYYLGLVVPAGTWEIDARGGCRAHSPYLRFRLETNGRWVEV